MNRYQYPFGFYDLKQTTGLSLNNNDLIILMVLDFIHWIVGGGETLFEAIKKSADSMLFQGFKDWEDNTNRYKLGSCITFLALEKIYEVNIKDEICTFNLPDFDERIEYRVERFGPRREGIEAVVQKNDQLSSINYFKVLLEVVKKLQNYQLLK